ncbi:hypothetical protein GDO86_006586 [Hymenochirus boettgeri]|uniref:BRICHOS domain-containing protein n=1 Tax=Hymenochirus boettgeri TaxID=247094 RepID=A0A8T2JBG0_9PIPI|nr:hypothetical protein GDO86_006586 [Hymenochirus boettgeri]
MKFLIVAFALLGVSLATGNIEINNVGDDGSDISQNININNQNNVANINNWNGLNSWDSICDFGSGFAATRMFSKKICVITKINPETFPNLTQLRAMAKDKQYKPSQKMNTYIVNQSTVSNFGEYGKHIESMCKGVPSYTAQEIPSFEEGFAVCQFNSVFSLIGINLCF